MTLISSSEAAGLLAVKPATLRKWVERGWLVNHGSKRRALFDIAELTDLAMLTA